MEYGMQGQVALVTGAARDVGRQIALGLAAEGDLIIITKGELSGVTGGTNSMKILKVTQAA